MIVAAAVLLLLRNAAATATSNPKNVIVMLADNLGYADISYFRDSFPQEPSAKSMNASASPSSTTTPHLDALARDRSVFWHHWNSAAHLCSASRAAVLTGREPVRDGIYPSVFARDAANGLDPAVPTLARLLQTHDPRYKTAIVGKWHLGHRTPYLPTFHGFDEWHGIPFHMSGGSVDGHVCQWDGDGESNSPTGWLPLYQNESIVEQPVRLHTLADHYVRRARAFMHQASGAEKRPFFLYVPFSHVHQLCAPRSDEQTTCQWTRDGPNQPFASAVAEMDWMVGQILETLEQLQITNNTLLWFTADNGPWVAEQACSGSKGPFRGQWLQDNCPSATAPPCTACPHDYQPDYSNPIPHTCRLPGQSADEDDRTLQGVPCGHDTGLGSVWEANLRVPTLVSWPGTIPAPHQIQRRTGSSLDIVPTTLALLNISVVPKFYDWDGQDISQFLLHPDTDKLRDQDDDRVLFFWRDGFADGPLPAPYGRVDIAAVKVGRLKFWFWTKSAHYNDDPAVHHDPPLVFDVLADPAEAHPLQPEQYNATIMVPRIKRWIAEHRKHVGKTYPRALERDPRYVPCVDADNDCRTHPPPQHRMATG